jgi:phage major head subunit gpT-like protein
MIINQAGLNAITTILRVDFNKAFGAQKNLWPTFAMEVNSTSNQNDYQWLGQIPAMRRWVGAKHVKNLKQYGYSIINEDFEVTVEIARNHIEDDQLGMYNIQAQIAGQSAAQLPDDLAFEALSNGFTAACFDGQPFYSAEHDVGGQLVSNTSTVKLAASSIETAKASYGLARAEMLQFKGDDGQSLKVLPNLLVVGAALEATAKILLTSEKLENNDTNPYRGTAELLVHPNITDESWHLLDTSKVVKPIIYQSRKKPVFVSQTNPDSPDVFNLGRYKFGAEARAAAGYGFWQLAFGSTGTGTVTSSADTKAGKAK